ncbi:MAG: AAA family ATPase, partial [Candidatus Bipolaricaulia bacterium]
MNESREYHGGIEPGPGPDQAIYEGEAPYRGLEFFDVQHAPFFFGREALTDQLLNELRLSTGSGQDNRFLSIIGPSGSGKSSLARAGLVAALRHGEIEGSKDWLIAICRPDADPLESLVMALSKATGAGQTSSAVRDLIEALRSNERTLHIITRLALRDAPQDRRLVLLVDQFEELFTLCDDEHLRQALINNLLYAASIADGRTVVLLTLGADFYDECATYPVLAAALSDHQILVGPMTDDELRRAIERPAQLVECEFETGLVERILYDAGEKSGNLSPLELALTELWTRRQGRLLTHAAYEDIGEIAGVIAQRAEEESAKFTPEQREVAEPEAQPQREPEPAQALAEEPKQTAETERQQAEEQQRQTEEPGVARRLRRMALIVVVLLVVGFGAFAFIQYQEAIEQRQAAVKQLQETEVQRQLAEKQRRIAEEQRQEAEQQRQLALARQLSAQAESVRVQHAALLPRSVLLAVESLRRTPTLKGNQVLSHNLSLIPPPRMTHEDSVGAVAFSPDERRVVSGGGTTARVWETETGRELSHMTHQDTVWAVAFSRDGRWVASGGGTTARVWGAETGQELSRLTHEGLVRVVAFSPDGRWVASGGGTTARVWETETGREIARMRHRDWVYAVAFSPDGRWIASGSWDNTARVWEIETGRELSRMLHEDSVGAVAFSPDGRWVVSGSWDGTARVWEAETGREVAHMTHQDEVKAVAFSPDGRWVVSGSWDGTARVWEAETGRELSRMTHGDRVETVAFSPDGRWVASGGGTTARVWETET